MKLETTGIGLVIQAAHFAADKHRDQRRKGIRNTPYINHPLEVAERLHRIGGIEDATVLAAAILHDTIEDTQTTRAELAGLFGNEIAAIVAELSDDKTLTWQQRKRLEIDHAPHLSATGKMIKLSDKTSNVSDTVTNPPGEWTLSRRRDYLEFARLVADGCRGVNAPLEAEFDRVMADARGRIG
ncbi:MAG: HD domain-containing protein [Hyphomicrobiaceae bacterium]|nr:HD domain-containing protein [Hyphomicrobiaceae bacterium]